MSHVLSRRSLVTAGGAIAMLPLLDRSAIAASQPASAPQRLTAGSRIIEVDGRAAKVFRLSNAAGQNGLSLAPGEAFHVALTNALDEPTIIHWHGQLPPWTQDGFPWPQTPPLTPHSVKSYDYNPIAGTYWMHSHQGMQEQRLMTAPLIVHDAATLREDRQEIVLMLHDFSFKTPDELLAGLTGQTQAAAHAMSRASEAQPASPMSMSGMSGMSGMQSGGMSGMSMDSNDIRYDAFLANDRTLADPAIIPVNRGGRLRLRVINGASSSQFWIDLGALHGTVVAVDGHAVLPIGGSRFPIAIAQRLDILLDLPAAGAFPILARLEDSRRRTGIVLATPGAAIPKYTNTGLDHVQPIDNAFESRLVARNPLHPRKPDLVHRIVMSGAMKPYRWSLNGAFWPNITPLMLKPGQRVELDLVNHSMMAHPMHLHGHSFQVIAINGRPINGAVRDTVLVTPMMGSVRIAFDAINPGRWAFHCHNLYHMMTGMMTEFRYQGIPA